MTINEIRQKYLDFMAENGHKIIPSTSLVPEGDATTLFTSAGMQPMMPYLLGQKHPLGTKIADSQKCFRAVDIEEVGDNRHTTFFEMLGNWSLGDYFKKEQLKMFFTFLTDSQYLGIDPQRLYVSVFAGGSGVPKDSEAIAVWQELFRSKGVDAEEGRRIFAYGVNKNWWSRAGAPENMPPGEPGGPDSEVFYDFGEEFKLHETSPWKNEKCHINCDCGRFLEIGNSVFMQYVKKADGTLEELPQKNIDFGGGLTRLEAAVNNTPDMFKISSLSKVIEGIESISGHQYSIASHQPQMRIIADHLTASVFLIKDGVLPGNKSQGYVLRRLLRRCAMKMYFLTGGRESLSKLSDLVKIVVDFYQDIYFDKDSDFNLIKPVIDQEISKFSLSLDKGIKELSKLEVVDGKVAFDLYQNYGFPLEITSEVLSQIGKTVDIVQFQKEFEQHKQLSRSTSAGMFKGGLANHTQTVTAYHTATHLLHAALRKILGNHVQQKGSNITSERLRFDFSHPDKIDEGVLLQIEELINRQISEKLPVTKTELPKEEALKQGALAFFGQKYPDIVSIYTIGDPKNFISKEFCGGPHVESLAELANIKIVKQESLGAGVRRLYLKFV